MSTNETSESQRDFEVRVEKAKVLRKWDIAVYIVIMLVVLLTLGQAWIGYRDDHRDDEALENYVRCQADWTSFLYRANAAGRTANAATQQAMDDLVNAVASAKSTNETRVALDRYKAAREAQKVALQQNPLPPPPGEVCELG